MSSFSHHIKIGVRHLVRNKMYAGVSILGLAIGIACAVLIGLYVNQELTYDHYHSKADRIARLTSVLHFNGVIDAGVTNVPAGPTIKEEYPEVEEFARFRNAGAYVDLSVDEKSFRAQNTWYADSTVFKIFDYNILQGDTISPLSAPRSLVLTKDIAQLIFGSENPIGKQVIFNQTPVTVTAIIDNIPENSEMQINAMLSMSSLPQQYFDVHNADWFRIGNYTYLLFNQEPNVSDFEEKLVEFEKRHVQANAEEAGVEASLEFHITPLKELHFDNGRDYDLPKGNMAYVYVFSLLALFIVIIASINYVNLTLAQGSKRSKEVGVRKALGADQSQLFYQFIGESLLVAFIAAIVGMCLVEVFMNPFNAITGKNFETQQLLEPSVALILTALILFIGFVSSSYPSLVLSRLKPIVVLKGKMASTGKIGGLKKALILIQFIFSLFMISGTFLINNQMNYLRDMNLGFDKENVMTMVLPADTNVLNQAQPWIEELRQDNRIVAVSRTTMPTGNSGELMFRIEQEDGLKERNIRFLFVDESFVDVLGVDLVDGRNFNREIATDQQQAFIINQQAAKEFGWDNKALNKRMQWGLMPNNQAANDGVVVGVLKDFNFLSLHNPMEPLVLCFNPNLNRTISVRFAKGDYTSILGEMEQRWKQIAPSHEFNYNFLDDQLKNNYETENQVHSTFQFFAIVSILLASMGLFALLSYSIETRIKEIGIRKVLGASNSQIVWVMSKDFAVLLAIAFVIVIPINTYLMAKWLESFAYSVNISPISFILALLSAACIAALTVAYHSIQIGKTDPGNALRYE